MSKNRTLPPPDASNRHHKLEESSEKMTKRSKKYNVKPNRLNNTADQIERTLELSDVDTALAETTYPGKGQTARMRGLFMDFLAALRPHGSPLKGNRSVTCYFRGDTLVALFQVRNYLISINRIRNSDSMSRVMAVAIEELAGIVRPKSMIEVPLMEFPAPLMEIPVPAAVEKQTVNCAYCDGKGTIADPYSPGQMERYKCPECDGTGKMDVYGPSSADKTDIVEVPTLDATAKGERDVAGSDQELLT